MRSETSSGGKFSSFLFMLFGIRLGLISVMKKRKQLLSLVFHYVGGNALVYYVESRTRVGWRINSDWEKKRVVIGGYNCKWGM